MNRPNKRAAAALSDMGRRTSDPPISWLMKMTLDRPQLISLAAGFTDDLSLPVRETRDVLGQILSSARASRRALQYGSTLGDPRLRESTAARLQQLDGVEGKATAYVPDRVIITNGSQQLLYLLSELLCDPGDIVLVEDPTYFVYLGILQSHGLRCRGVRMESDGIDLDHLRRVLDSLNEAGDLPKVKLLYSVTYFQNPSGITTSFEKKSAALAMLREYEAAAGHPIYLLEDAAYRELRFAGPDVRSALAVRGAGDRVLYAGTYSKPFATGVRVGYGVLPEPVLSIAARLKGNHDFGTANLLQQILVRALESGMYERHLAALRRRYRRKAGAMASALEEHFPKDVVWQRPAGGLYIWACLPRRLQTGMRSKLFRRALNQDVLYVPGEICFGPDSTRRPNRSAMRLSFGGASEQEIWRGIARLGEVLRKLCK